MKEIEGLHNQVNKSLNNNLSHANIIIGNLGVANLCYVKKYIKLILQADASIDLKIDQETLTDLLIIDKGEKSEIGIEMIRNAQDFFYQTPGEVGAKFVVINRANGLGKNAANALLKILEEPVANTYLFLLTDNLFSIIPTIRSRCRIIKINPENSQEFQRTIVENNLQKFTDFIAGSSNSLEKFASLKLNEIYQEIFSLIENPVFNVLSKFYENYAKKTDMLDYIENLILFIIMLATKFASGNLESKNFTLQELDQIKELAKNKKINEWIAIYDQTKEQFSKTRSAHLDRKQIMFITLTKISKILISKE